NALHFRERPFWLADSRLISRNQTWPYSVPCLSVALLIRVFQQFLEIALPNCSDGMCAMPASLIRNRQQHVSTVLHALDLSFHYSQLRRIDQIISRVNRDQLCFDLFEHWSRVILTRRVEVVERVVGIASHYTTLHPVLVEFICRITSRRLFVPQQRRASH